MSNYLPGVDIVDVARIKNSIENYKGKFLNKIFSKDGKVLSEAEKMIKPTKKVEAEIKDKTAVTSK